MVKWLIDGQLTKDSSYENLKQLIEQHGHECAEIKYIPFSRLSDYQKPFDNNDCVIVYGTIEFVRIFRSEYFGAFLNEKNLEWHNYYANSEFDKNHYLNNDFILTTFSEIKNRFDKYSQLFNTSKLFIRPNSGAKLFTGLPLNLYNYYDKLNALEQLSGAVNSSLILVCKQKSILDESRFIIVGDEVVAGSRYNINGIHKEDINYSKEALELANIVAKSSNKPEEIFTCDVAMTNHGPKIVELNSFSSAGWYACDANIIIDKVSSFVLDMYNKQKGD